MKRLSVSLIVLLAIAVFAAPAEARRRRGGAFAGVPSGCSNKTAQDVADCCAKDGRLAHRGGNSGYEGLGLASTPEAAYRSCCYANSGMPDADVGYAQMKNGQWVCCRRYGRR